MTQNDIINRVDEVARDIAKFGSVSGALAKYYTRRYVVVPYPEHVENFSYKVLPLNVRCEHALDRTGVISIADLVALTHKSKWWVGIKAFGKSSAQVVLESLLDFAWDFMNTDARAEFLINFVIDNADYYKEVNK